MMVCVARYMWASGVRLLFNIYTHHHILVMRGEKELVFILSKEGIVQGDPLVMVDYELLVVPLNRKLKDEFISVDSLWYTDAGSAESSLENSGSFFKRLEEIGPAYGYFPEERKIILVVRGRNTEKGNIFKEKYNFNFQIKNDYRYLGGHIDDLEEEDVLIEKNERVVISSRSGSRNSRICTSGSICWDATSVTT